MTRWFGKTLLAVAALGLISFAAQSASAQWGRATVRHLGVLTGDGYHKATPLTDPGYYYPYSAHNSTYYGAHDGPQHYPGSQYWSGNFGYPHQPPYYPGSKTPKSWVDRPLPPWHGYARRNVLGL